MRARSLLRSMRAMSLEGGECQPASSSDGVAGRLASTVNLLHSSARNREHNRARRAQGSSRGAVSFPAGRKTKTCR
jgi:hypothetical protein